jgi:phenylalanyl-tRNA synthetase beta chain
MNILIPHSWLLEHVETDVSPTELQKSVSLCGPSIERIYDKDGESVYDIEVTTNRVDSMSVRGIAREVAVILPQFNHAATLKPLNIDVNLGLQTAELPLPKISNQAQLCKRILCVVLDNVEHTPTPEWMAKRLGEIDQHVHDSVIDISNYITHELGHPCHAFDYDKIMALGGSIEVVLAKAGQPFKTLDGVEYKAVGGEVVFVNPQGDIIDLPAIKGTENSSISNDTKRVLLWIEDIEASKVRFASMTHSIRTVAAQLNEKNVDPELGMDVLKLGVKLYQELCHAQVASPVFDEFPGKQKPQVITSPLTEFERYLGVSLSPESIADLLTKIGGQVTFPDKQTIEVVAPSFRPDLTIPADLVEEVARIYGYHNLPSTLMATPLPLIRQEGVNFVVEDTLKNTFADMGWQELYTYSMISQELALESGYTLAKHLKLQNPLSDDKTYLRRTLVPSLKEILDQNPLRPLLSVFEIAMVYEPVEAAPPKHILKLSLASRQSYRAVRGDLEAVLSRLFITEVEVKPGTTDNTAFSQIGDIWAKSSRVEQPQHLGSIGILKNGYVVSELEMSALLAIAQKHPHYQPIPKTSPIMEDFTFTVPSTTQVGPALTAIKQLSPWITQVTLKGTYQQNYTISVQYQDSEQNLSAVEVEPVRRDIASLLTKDFGWELVGTLQ